MSARQWNSESLGALPTDGREHVLCVGDGDLICEATCSRSSNAEDTGATIFPVTTITIRGSLNSSNRRKKDAVISL